MKEFAADVRQTWRDCQNGFERGLLVVLLPLLFVAYWFYRFLNAADPD